MPSISSSVDMDIAGGVNRTNVGLKLSWAGPWQYSWPETESKLFVILVPQLHAIHIL